MTVSNLGALSQPDPAPVARDAFQYGPNGARFVRHQSWDEAGTQKEMSTVYLEGGAFEEVHASHNPSVDRYTKVMAGGAALVFKVHSGGSATTYVEYKHRDHLGSVVAVTNVVGGVLREFGFDPFGERRSADWGSDLTQAERDTILLAGPQDANRGYTDHEHMDRTGFIHMNGRLYDGRIGRFVQPDPIVVAPDRPEAFNRYAYTLGQPMNATDPSGLTPVEIVVYGTPPPSFSGGLFSGTEFAGSAPSIAYTEFGLENGLGGEDFEIFLTELQASFQESPAEDTASDGGPSGAVGADTDVVSSASRSEAARQAWASTMQVAQDARLGASMFLSETLVMLQRSQLAISVHEAEAAIRQMARWNVDVGADLARDMRRWTARLSSLSRMAQAAGTFGGAVAVYSYQGQLRSGNTLRAVQSATDIGMMAVALTPGGQIPALAYFSFRAVQGLVEHNYGE